MKFPDALPIPMHVHEGRETRLRELTSACLRAMGIRGGIILLELVGFFLFASHALLLDALSSCMDLICSFVLIGCLRLAKQPPDRNHPFGHGRLEPIAGLGTACLLIQIGMYLVISQLQDLSHGPSNVSAQAGWFALASAALLQVCYYLMHHYGKRHQSPAILAEAIHYRLDALNSLIACAALGMGALIPNYIILFDRLGALFIAVMMMALGLRAAKSNFDQLTDRKPSEDLFHRIRSSAHRVQGVCGTEKIRIQHYGPDAHVDIDIEVDPTMSVVAAHEISQHVRRAIQSEWPAVQDVTVHIEPFFEGDHISNEI